jgi:hypothetical protein
VARGGGERWNLGGAGFKPRDLGSDRGYRVANGIWGGRARVGVCVFVAENWEEV